MMFFAMYFMFYYILYNIIFRLNIILNRNYIIIFGINKMENDAGENPKK